MQNIPTSRPPWFRLDRHDDPEPQDPPEVDPGAGPQPEEPDADPEGADQLGDAGKKALDRMKAEKAEARRTAAAEKKRADELAKKVEEFEDRDKSELDKATTRAERLAEQATKATQRAVAAEIKAAAGEFADPRDAIAFLRDKSYASDDGEIDTDAIAADLEALLEEKPHLRKATAAPQAPKAPRPDPSQGPRQEPPPTDWSKASRSDLSSELARYGVRLR